MFMSKVKNEIKLVDGHYEIPLPIRENFVLPCNISLARSRLNKLKLKLSRDETLRTEYTEFMNNVISKGYAEIVPSTETDQTESTWYLPHHAVRHPKKNKVRVVFDGAAKYGGVCLNDALMQGPDLTNNLIGVLVRFRQWPVAVSADIESMFYQVRVSKKDSNLLRFLWWKNGDLDSEPLYYRMVVHIFGSVSSPTCANLALRTTAESAKNAEITHGVLKSFYLDDFLKSFKTDEEAVMKFRETKAVCADGGFRLHKVVSNSREVLTSVSSHEWSRKDMNLSEELPTERALGVSWEAENDQFTFQVSVSQDKPATRRGILSTVSAVYDPLGFASPFTLPAKILLQQICKNNLSWDDEIPEHLKKQFAIWTDGLPHLEELKIPRCMTPLSGESKYELHYFSDASDVGYGVVCYLRAVQAEESVSCSFVVSKSRVAPLKKITIPRLELTAASVAVRLNNSLVRELDITITETVYWSDSATVLRYINNDTARYQTFVANRVNLILEGSAKEQWRYVPSPFNPADLASRGASPRDLEASEKWFNGPAYLYEDRTKWPENCVNRSIDENDPVVKAPKAIIAATVKNEVHPIEKIIEHFSEWWKAKRAVAWLTLFVRMLKQKVKQTGPIEGQKRLCISDISEAELKILKYEQSKHFGKEKASLENTKLNRVSKQSPLYGLDPYILDGIIRVGGRLSRATTPFDAKHQIVISKNSRIAHLLIDDAHRSVGHLAKNSIQAYVRTRFWIVHCTSMIKSVVSKCVDCKRYRGEKASQKMADIPRERLAADKPPFANMGIDYFGPLEVKRGRITYKRYGVVFTCLTSRAVHLELATSLETDSCVNAIRRFIARRGAVEFIRSDNGTNLVGAQADMKRALEKLDMEKIEQFCAKHDIQWEFNPPLASHFGGIWERMIRTVRKILFHLIRDSSNLTDELLRTLLCEAEMIINNRPLCETDSSDANDPAPLTPNHLLLMQPKSDFPTCGVYNREDNSSKRRWRQVQFLTHLFWKRFSEEYLHTLQVRTKWNRKRRNVSVGDVVLIMDTKQRSSWITGKVVNVEQDSKGFVRVASIKTTNSEFHRPVDKLCVLVESQS